MRTTPRHLPTPGSRTRGCLIALLLLTSLPPRAGAVASGVVLRVECGRTYPVVHARP